MEKVLITWSKWKTSMTMLLDSLINNSLVVNSEFLRIKEKNKQKYFKSGRELLKIYNAIPSWTPFKFLILQDFFSFNYYIAETDISNAFSQIPWTSLWTKTIDIGILTNIFPEHIDGKLIKSFDELIEKKLYLLFWSTHYKKDKITKLIINVNDKKIYKKLLEFIEKYKDKNFKIYLLVDKNLYLKIDKKLFEEVLFYDNDIFWENSIKDYKLSFNWYYKPASSILSILYFFKKINNLETNLKNISFPRWLWRMDLVEKNWNLFLIDHISEKNSFEWLINLLEKVYYNKNIELIFSLKYDASDSKIDDFANLFEDLLNKWVIKKIYLYDNLQVRWVNDITTRNWEYKSFDLVRKLKWKIKNKNIEILENRDEKIKELILQKNKNKLFIISLNSIESPYFKKEFNLF